MPKQTAFEQPVVVWLHPEQHELGIRRIWDVEDGLAALHRYGIEHLRRAGAPCREWREAAAALTVARRCPTPNSVAHARQALGNAAAKAGALAVPQSLSVLAAKDLDFAP